MPTTRQFSSVTPIAAPAARVWALMTDHRRYGEWGSAQQVTIDAEGDPPPNGLGAVRVFHAGPVKVREEVTVWEPPGRMVYRLVGGLPVRHYRSEMVLIEVPGGCELHWSSDLVPRFGLLGPLLERTMRSAVDGFREGIRSVAEGEPE